MVAALESEDSGPMGSMHTSRCLVGMIWNKARTRISNSGEPHAAGPAGTRQLTAAGRVLHEHCKQHQHRRYPAPFSAAANAEHALSLWVVCVVKQCPVCAALLLCRRPGDSRWSMAASAFHYVWPTTGILRARLAACFVLVMAERAINLAAPVAFKHMVEVLGDITTAAAAAAAADPDAAAVAGPLEILQMGARSLLMALAGQHNTRPPVLQAAADASMIPTSNSTMLTAVGFAAAASEGGSGAGGAESLAPFWVLFYPWAFIYLGAFFLRGGSGSEGLLTNIRDILYIPITQVRRHPSTASRA